MLHNNFFQKISRYYFTVKDLKCRQIFYRLYYSVAHRRRRVTFRLSPVAAYPVVMQESIAATNMFADNNVFSFINLSCHFHDKIDWNYTAHGMLWAYNLNYFEFLVQENISKEDGIKLINDYIDQRDNIRVGLDPYPISLRNIFWIRFIAKHSIHDHRINSFLYENYNILLKKIEYHLLGNHLLENAYSLLFGAYYFRDEKFYKKAKKLLIHELNEQILEDGAHFELSPMYHQIMLYRLLDCINLVSNNDWKNGDLLAFFRDKASKMVSWINAVTFNNGDIPPVNDAAFGVSPSAEELNHYSKRMSVKNTSILLNASGYRMFKSDKFELFIDVGAIGPKYQPGHSHADTFNFLLYSNHHPVIIDSGTSTYEVNAVRFYERSTAAHNTVEISQKNSSDVWAGHRTAHKAKVRIIKDSVNIVQASHNGYQNIGGNHIRTFEFQGTSVKIVDEVSTGGIAYFHFHPDESISKIDHHHFRGNSVDIKFTGANRIEWSMSHYSSAFNNIRQNKSLRIFFSKHLETFIQ